jgi:hypothetical protein
LASKRQLLLALSILQVAGCSASGTASPSSTAPVTSVAPPGSGGESCAGGTQGAADLPQVGRIRDAITALEQHLGGAQRFFEVNTTARVVNLWVALDNGTVAQPWVYVDGQLSSKEGAGATGGTFRAGDLTFDATKVLAGLRAKIPDATLESFQIVGDGKGAVQYEVFATACRGGGLDVVLGPDGAVKSVTPT